MKKLPRLACLQSNRRDFVRNVGAAFVSPLPFSKITLCGLGEQTQPDAFSSLHPLGARMRAISNEEFRGRLARAQQLMREMSPKFDAIFVVPGTSLYYFTGIRWWPSERLLALLLPRTGDPIFVCPAFEEGRLREQLRYPA